MVKWLLYKTTQAICIFLCVHPFYVQHLDPFLLRQNSQQFRHQRLFHYRLWNPAKWIAPKRRKRKKNLKHNSFLVFSKKIYYFYRNIYFCLYLKKINAFEIHFIKRLYFDLSLLITFHFIEKSSERFPAALRRGQGFGGFAP